MASREEIRAVFADPQLDGMDELYQCIGEMLQDGADFENAYSLVIAAGGNQPTPGSGSACNAPHGLMIHPRNQSSLRY